MANYHYDESGNMAGYFVITFLALVLIPLSISQFTPSKSESLDGCQCTPCVEQRKRVAKREQGYLLNPKLSRKATFIAVGWSIFALLVYKVGSANQESKVYNPFEILGLASSTSEKDIKSHFKKLSRLYHPDKVKLTANQTIETVQDKFVEITKAYKSLTDETIRENLRKWGHPDGRQEMSMGIALPQWIIEGKNNIWVLGLYGIIFGGALPALVGRWWFGSRQKTKDGINARSASVFFKSLKEESSMSDVVNTFSSAYQWEISQTQGDVAGVDALEKAIEEKAGVKWSGVLKMVGRGARRRALVLIYAHFLRIEVGKTSLQKEQTKLLLQAPLILNALLNVATARTWLLPTLAVMRLHAYLAQALLPGSSEQAQLTQLPGIKDGDVEVADVGDAVRVLEEKGDARIEDVRRAVERWGRVEIVDVVFKVIGERLVTPSSIVFLVVKLRLVPPAHTPAATLAKELDAEETKKAIKGNEEKDLAFLNGKKEAEDLDGGNTGGYAHAPFWPGNRKPSWWIVLADDKSNRVVVPPMKISDIPLGRTSGVDVAEGDAGERDYRSYKLQFQAPQTVGLFTWKVYIVSDTYVGEETGRSVVLKIDDVTALNADEQVNEDEISDPEEDSLAGQMAAMRGGSVKKREDEEESEEESGTDDDGKGDSDSDSDSD